MGADSKIEWTHHSFNPWRGCTKVSQGCKHCYAETLSGRNPATLGVWGPKGSRPIAAEAYWRQPLKWDREAKEAGERRRVFCASLADVFEGPETMPEGAREAVALARCRLFRHVIPETPNLDWLILTKRPENINPMLFGSTDDQYPVIEQMPPNVWFGTSVEDQATADQRIPELLKVNASVRFLSCEPLLGPVKLWEHDEWNGCLEGVGIVREGIRYPSSPNGPEEWDENIFPGIDWVIVGGESGADARPMHWKWAESLRDQCRAADVPYFFKQWGAFVPEVQAPAGALSRGTAQEALYVALDGNTRPARYGARGDACTVQKVGKHKAGRLLDGRTWDEFPEVAHV